MEDTQLQNLWEHYNEKLEEVKILSLHSLAFNFKSFEMQQRSRAKARLRGLLLPKIFSIILGVLFILVIVEIFVRYYRNTYFAVSGGCIILLTLVTIFDYIKQIIIISGMDLDDGLIQTQQKLVFLQTSIIRSVRVAFLQLPFYTTFYITQGMIQSGGTTFWIFMSVFSGSFVVIALFLYRNISYKNINTKWVRSLISGSGGTSVIKAMEFINEIETFKKEVPGLSQ